VEDNKSLDSLYAAVKPKKGKTSIFGKIGAKIKGLDVGALKDLKESHGNL